ncbi:MOSC domain-containing protein [Streptosporangium saharense]|uniref:MOSC domain-containing protein YiiM n=1 Tax=Streptosporangium saharense TaxID=1706840 RepID=A0A7W7QNK1_9ACTN|nr:MOSC domain-containing protein [Streptosporangium saharense]MBB4916744.1 MOSC domain-containing protein YiiM [Streptosporangium saharense]
MAQLLSVNIGHPRTADYTDAAFTGIDKRPARGPVAVAAPGGPTGTAGSGVAGDVIGDLHNHGGDDQAVYAYAREDLDLWESELGRGLSNGVFGENLTTSGLDVNGALIGERWRVGADLLLEVTSARIPCRTFAGWLEDKGWVRRFTQAARPGAYFRVIEPGRIEAGDRVEIVARPGHDVTVEVLFRALTTEAELLPRTLAAGDALNAQSAARIRRRLERGRGVPS